MPFHRALTGLTPLAVVATAGLQLFLAFRGFDHCDVHSMIIHDARVPLPPRDALLQATPPPLEGLSPHYTPSEASASPAERSNLDDPENPSRYIPPFNKAAAGNASLPIVDVLSVGSLTRTEYQDSQQATWASHVRQFVRVDERNDTEADCHKLLSRDMVFQISDRCRSGSSNHSHLDKIRVRFASSKYLSAKSNPAGWMCAQKRPIDGLRLLMDRYSSRSLSLPDYLFVVDDDTWVNLPMVTEHLLHHFPDDQPTAVAGCRMRYVNKKEADLTVPFGGYGTILTRAAIERLLRPIHCDAPGDPWMEAVCLRLQDNSIGELPLFRKGMSVIDIMSRYTFDQAYLNVTEWRSAGYCFHSDWNLAYFINFYVSDGLGLREYRGSERVVGLGRPRVKLSGECEHVSDKTCDRGAHLCHYVTPEHMTWLHQSRTDDHSG